MRGRIGRNLMGNPTSPRRAPRNIAKCMARGEKNAGKTGREREGSGGRTGDTQGRDDASVRSRGFPSHRFVNVKFLWRSRKTYRAGCHVADFQFPARESPAFKEEGGKGREGKRERERKRERLRKVGGRYGAIGIAPSDCRGLRKCEVHADSVLFLDQKTRSKRERVARRCNFDVNSARCVLLLI